MFERSRHGAVDVVTGEVPIHVDHVDTLSGVLSQCVAEGQPKIVLDLTGTALFDSAGLELLLTIQKDCQRRGGMLKLAGANPLCTEILSLTGVGNQFNCYENTGEAVRSFVE
jgi:anti-anti-sigma factor